MQVIGTVQDRRANGNRTRFPGGPLRGWLAQSLSLATLLGTVTTTEAQLGVVNGGFSDLTGMTDQHADGWFSGLPAGWSGTPNLYAVNTNSGPTSPVCNPSVLGTLKQNIGTLTQAADVVLTMDVTDAWHKGAELNAEILDADGELFGRIQLDAGRAQRLVAGKLPAGTSVVIRFCALNGTTPALDNVSVATHAPGSVSPTPQFRVRRFQPDQPLARARREASVSAVLDHLNTEDVDVAVSLSLPPGVRVVQSNVGNIHHLRAAESRSRLTWKLEANAPMAADLRLDLKTADGIPIVYEPLQMLFLPPLETSAPPYIPEPKPVATDRLVGAHHCPLWEADQPNMWLNLLKHPERTPALGFYSQENPEVSDWETKWAVEHGVSFFIYCWYRTSQGGAVKTRFGSAIHDALFKSRYADKMKFTIMWENQDRGKAGVADEQDLFTNLLPYWMENYFKHPSYLKVDNKPVLFIYRPEFLVDDLGGVTNVAKAFARMRQVCREAGFAGLYLLGEYRGTDPKHLELMKNLGLDYTFAYCWPVPDSPTPERAIQAQMDNIRKTQELNTLPQVVTVSQAWSGWQDEGSIWKIPPPQFESLLRQAKAFTATLPKDQLGSRMLLLDNWNEWGEGHYIAPYREYGFGYLDAVRRVFSSAPADHADLLPEDIGRGPYDKAMRTHFEAMEEKGDLASVRAVKPGTPPGLVAWWTFDEPADSPVALDYSGQRNGGYVEKAARAPGFDGNALQCAGGCVFLHQNRSLGELQKFTIACRVKADIADQDNRWMVNSVFGHNVRGGFRLGLLAGKPCFQVPQTEWSHHLIGREPLPVGKWVHLAATFDGTTMRLYLEGHECGTMSRPGALLPTDGRLVLGNYEVGHAGFFKGLLDDVQIYRRVLSPAEIRSDAATLPK